MNSTSFTKIKEYIDGISSEKKEMIVLVILTALLLFSAITNVKNAVVANSSVTSSRKIPIYCVECDEPKIALTFDAAWDSDSTPAILDILKNHNIKATFFVTGGWVERYPEDLLTLYNDGHDIANHSQGHKDMVLLSPSEQQKEIMELHNKVKELTGYDMQLFRPPYGSYNNNLITTATQCGYYSVQWDIDSLDWKDYGVESIINTVTNHKHLGNGSIILCHVGAKYTPDALDVMLTKLEDMGYSFVPVSELIIKDNYYIDHEGRQIAN